jgi:predicted nucleotidyltransferase
MMNKARIDIPKDKIAEFCRRHHIRKLSLFGSVLRDDFQNDSDVDVLVEFEPSHGPGFIGLMKMERELSLLLGGRQVDLVTEKFLNRRMRNQVLANAEIQYAEG